MIVKAPARSYDGFVLAKVVGVSTDTRGRLMYRVEALQGEPWDDAGMFGWSSTNARKFYPCALELSETATTVIEAESKNITPLVTTSV